MSIDAGGGSSGATAPVLGNSLGEQRYGSAVGTVGGEGNKAYYLRIIIPVACTLTGIRYLVAGTASGNVRSGLYDSAGNNLRFSTSIQEQPGALAFHNVNFDGGAQAMPAGLYIATLWFASGTATFRSAEPLTPATAGVAGIPGGTITPPANPTTSAVPSMVTY